MILPRAFVYVFCIVTMKIEGQSIFKQGILPEWEDQKNSHGGELRVTLDGISISISLC